MDASMTVSRAEARPTGDVAQCVSQNCSARRPFVLVAGRRSAGGGRASIDAVFAEHVKAVQARDLPALERTITSASS